MRGLLQGGGRHVWRQVGIRVQRAITKEGGFGGARSSRQQHGHKWISMVHRRGGRGDNRGWGEGYSHGGVAQGDRWRGWGCLLISGQGAKELLEAVGIGEQCGDGSLEVFFDCLLVVESRQASQQA